MVNNFLYSSIFCHFDVAAIKLYDYYVNKNGKCHKKITMGFVFTLHQRRMHSIFKILDI